VPPVAKAVSAATSEIATPAAEPLERAAIASEEIP